MCYKNEVQRNAEEKLQHNIKDMPQFIQDYFVFLGSSKSKINYWISLRQLFEWLISQNIIKNDIHSITKEDISNVTDINVIKYLDGLKVGLWGNPMSGSSIRTKLNEFSSFWSYLEEKDYVVKNIIKRIPKNKYKTAAKDVKVPTTEEIEQFINSIESMRDEYAAIRDLAIVKLFMGSGIRLEELETLDIKDLHLDTENPYIEVMGKGEQNDKVEVSINFSAKIALETYLQIRNLDPEVKNMDAVFISKYKDRFKKTSIQTFFKEHSNGKIHPHLLRHYVGTMMYKNGENAITIADQLRHGDINTTRTFYIKKDKKIMSDALNKIG